jgi:endonuclease-3
VQFTLALEAQPFLVQLRDRLLAVFGPQRDAQRFDPTSQLINAMLSSRTRDEVSRRAFDRLRHRYPVWDRLICAAPEDIEAIIHPVTFAARKAAELPIALGMIRAATGGLDLHFLADDNEEAAMQWLRRLYGVDTKIAAAVLNFSSLRKRVLVVDTHLLRIGARLGLLPPRFRDLPRSGDYTIGYELFMRLVPDEWDADDLYEFHWLLKYHGQTSCTYSAPRCRRCPIQDMCCSRGG